MRAVPPPSSYEPIERQIDFVENPGEGSSSYSEEVGSRERIYGNEFRVLKDLKREPVGETEVKLERNEYQDIGELFGAVNENPAFVASSRYSSLSSEIVDGEYTTSAPMYPSRTHRVFSRHPINVNDIPPICMGCFVPECVCRKLEDFDLSAFEPLPKT